VIREDGRTTRKFEPLNKLGEEEQAQVLQTANSEEFADLPPTQIVPILADKGIYIASESTFYRILRRERQLGHRQETRPAKERGKPEALEATGPNQIYSWDITYLPSTVKGLYFYLYLFLDIYSRKIVGWQIFEEESSDWASEILCEIAWREGIEPNRVTLHSDNGGPMKGMTMLAMMETLGVAASFSRPAVSNDNPYSESLFRTVKYRPHYPVRHFDTIDDARKWFEQVVNWYNLEHRHSGIRFVTPAQRHAGLDRLILKKRQHVLEKARQNNPERWSRNIRNCEPVQVVFLNPEKKTEQQMKKAA
jgi:transposase InsO family protein